MKRSAVFLSAVAFLVIFIQPIFAANWIEYHIDELGMDISLPRAYYAATSRTAKNRSRFTDAGVDYDALRQIRDESGMHLIAVSSTLEMEIDVYSLESEASQEAWHLDPAMLKKTSADDAQATDDLGFDELNEVFERFSSEKGFSAAFTGTFTTEQAGFLIYEASGVGENEGTHMTGMATILNGQNIYIEFYRFDAPVNDDNRNLMRNIVKSVRFAEIRPSPNSPAPTHSNPYLYLGLLLLIVLIGIPVTYTLRKKFKREDDEARQSGEDYPRAQELPRPSRSQPPPPSISGSPAEWFALVWNTTTMMKNAITHPDRADGGLEEYNPFTASHLTHDFPIILALHVMFMVSLNPALAGKGYHHSFNIAKDVIDLHIKDRFAAEHLPADYYDAVVDAYYEFTSIIDTVLNSEKYVDSEEYLVAMGMTVIDRALGLMHRDITPDAVTRMYQYFSVIIKVSNETISAPAASDKNSDAPTPHATTPDINNDAPFDPGYEAQKQIDRRHRATRLKVSDAFILATLALVVLFVSFFLLKSCSSY